jgi:hypothetical protein
MSITISLSAVLLAGAVYATEIPVTISNLVTGPKSRVQLTNTSKQPITAWVLATTTHAQGGRNHREVYTADGYLSEVTHGLPGASERLERLMPGESRDLPLDPLPSDATVEIIAVVLDDGSAIGDEPVIAPIFAKRVRERDGLKAVVDAFNEVLATRRGPDAVAALQERFAALVQRDDSIPCRAALDAVQNFGRKTNPDEIDQSLRTYADLVKRQYALAAKHATRRGTGV